MRFSTSMSSWISNVLSKLNRYSNLEEKVPVTKMSSSTQRWTCLAPRVPFHLVSTESVNSETVTWETQVVLQIVVYALEVRPQHVAGPPLVQAAWLPGLTGNTICQLCYV